MFPLIYRSLVEGTYGAMLFRARRFSILFRRVVSDMECERKLQVGCCTINPLVLPPGFRQPVGGIRSGVTGLGKLDHMRVSLLGLIWVLVGW